MSIRQMSIPGTLSSVGYQPIILSPTIRLPGTVSSVGYQPQRFVRPSIPPITATSPIILSPTIRLPGPASMGSPASPYITSPLISPSQLGSLPIAISSRRNVMIPSIGSPQSPYIASPYITSPLITSPPISPTQLGSLPIAISPRRSVMSPLTASPQSPYITSPLISPTQLGSLPMAISPRRTTIVQSPMITTGLISPRLSTVMPMIPAYVKREPSDSELYDAATQPINIFAGNQPRWSIYKNPKTVEPTMIEMFGFDAYLIYDPQNPNRLFSVATDDGMNKTMTKQFKIAFTRWGWGRNNTGPFVLIGHGVPANQTQWWDVARLLAMVGFRVVTFDMLTMGWSTKPLFDNKEKMEKLRWVHDKYYVNWLADVVFGVGSKFVYIADDWGTGILHKYMETFGNRLLWAGDQDGIRGGAYPVPEIEDIGQASMLPMDERPQVLAGKIPPAPGSFQMAMGGANSSLTQILKTMAHTSSKKFNQWSMRPILRPFFSVDYERNATDPRGAAAPFNMPHKNFALKSMADRAIASLRSGDLSPYHPYKNPGGIRYSQIEVNLMLWSGEYDNMMSSNQRLRYKYWMPKSRVLTQEVPRAGHFSGVDQPKWIATMIIEFHSFLFRPGKPNSLPKPFLGFDGIFKGNEEKEAAAYEKLY